MSEEHKRRQIDYTSVAWPEVNPIDYTVAGNRMQNYRFPATCDPADRKGIVQWISGYGDYAGRYAWLAKLIAGRGYDVVGVDWRGFGHSEGKRGILGSSQ